MDDLYEISGYSDDKKIIELKKALIKNIADSQSCIMLFCYNNENNMFLQGDIDSFIPLISESMIKSSEFRQIILKSIEKYQEKMN